MDTPSEGSMDKINYSVIYIIVSFIIALKI
jgi:hypothetical protein